VGPVREYLEVDGNRCTPAERAFLWWAAEHLVGPDWHDIPIETTFRVNSATDGPADWISFAVFDKPRRVLRSGDIATLFRQVDITDTNRTAVCVLRAIAERQRR
jgi:hypothetical protein